MSWKNIEDWVLTIFIFSFGVGVIFLMASVCAFLAQAQTPAQAALRAATVHLDRGTGSIVSGHSGNKYILTNWHVCLVSQWKHRLWVSYPDGEMLTGDVVKKDPKKDLCAAKVKTGNASLTLAPKLLPTEIVCTRGFPGHIVSESCGKLGPISKWESGFGIEEVGECPDGYKKDLDFEGRLRGCLYLFTSRLTNLYARPGSSGSPVVDASGHLVGVVSSWHESKDLDAGIVTFEDVKEFLKDL